MRAKNSTDNSRTENRDRRVGDLTVGELVELIRQVLREEQAVASSAEYFVDEDGRLAFRSEAAYAAYLAKQGNRHPAEVNAYYLDARGRKSTYDAPPASEEAGRPARLAPQGGLEERRPQQQYDIQTSDTDRHEAARRRLRGE